MSSCLFCRIAAGEVPAKKVFEDDEILVFEDINPQAPLHLLLIPKKHIPTINDIAAEDQPVIGKIYSVAAELARQRGVSVTGYRIVANCNGDGGQVVFHLHFHLLGGRAMQWPPG